MTHTDEAMGRNPDDVLLHAIDGDLDQSQAEEFLQRLQTSPAALTEFLNLHGEHRLLGQVFSRRDETFVSQVMTHILSPDGTAGSPPSAAVSPFWRSSSIIGAAAVAAAALLMVLMRVALPLAAEPVGWLESLTASVQVGNNAATVGMPIAIGATVQTDDVGAGRIRLVDGSAVDLGAGSSAWIERKSKGLMVHLIAGRVDADVAHQVDGHHFSIVGDRASATAIGTRFTVWSDDQAMHVTVTDGEVAVARRSDGNSLSLQPGQRVRVAKDASFAVTSGRESSDLVAITDITLIDALHHKPIPAFTPLRDGVIIDLATLPSAKLNMLLSAKSGVADVGVAVDGVATSIRRRDQYRPFTVFGNILEAYKAWTPVPGTYKITLTPHGYDFQDGEIYSVTFTIIDSRAP